VTGCQGRPNGKMLAFLLAALALGSTAESEPTSVVPEKLYCKALSEGSVRVIVQLRLSALPGGQLGSADAMVAQRQAIAAAQSTVLAGLAGTTFRVIRTYEAIPFLALEVSPDALRALEKSPLVASMEEDRLESR